MRRQLLWCLLLSLALCPSALGQSRPSLVVSDIRVGFPGGNEAGEPFSLFKAGAWAPVYVEIKAEGAGYKQKDGRVEVVVSTPDPDDISTSYVVDTILDDLPAEKTVTILAYTKLAGSSPEVTVTLRSGGETIGQPVKKTFNGLEPQRMLYLTLGNRLAGVRSARRPNDMREDATESLAYLDRVSNLPAHWFGYQGVDGILLCTSNRKEFVLPLSGSVGHVAALREWTQRGGHLIVFAGRNARDLGDLESLLPVSFTRTEAVKDLELVFPDGTGREWDPVTGPQKPIEVARMEKKQGRTFRTLLSVQDARQNDMPLIVQAPLGLGRVTVVAFDPDQKPFVDWKNQAEFWHAFLRQFDAQPVANPEFQPNNTIDSYNSQEMLGEMQSYLENFEDVQPISFGWVVLFIFVYIIVVGPLEYFLLAKVVKRPELTWITFPSVVLTLSVLAYFAAYQLKGKDLRIRKVDLVDIDLRGGQTVGHTWFSLFSPRIQHYKVGVEPAAPDWAPEPGEGKTPSVLTSWMSRPDVERRSRPRTRRQSLFHRSYDYAEDASGLIGVPVQVWSTKAFTASWLTPRPERPLLSADLHADAADELINIKGTLTWCPDRENSQQFELEDSHLIYKGRAFAFPLEPGKAKDIKALEPMARAGQELNAWVGKTTENFAPRYRYNTWDEQPATNIEETMRAILFHRGQERGQRNAGLRQLDQTWRVRQEQQNEVILVARLKPRHGSAETVSQDAASPSRLWLGALPGPEAKREKLDGVMRQETFVRVFIPVKP